MDLDSAPDVAVSEYTGFVGDAVSTRWETEFTVSDVKKAWQAGDKRAVLPFLLIMVGFSGTGLFSGLALLVGMENKLFGLLFVGISLGGSWMVARDLLKA